MVTEKQHTLLTHVVESLISMLWNWDPTQQHIDQYRSVFQISGAFYIIVLSEYVLEALSCISFTTSNAS